MAAVTICSDLGAQKIKSDTVSTVSPSISHEVLAVVHLNLVYELSWKSLRDYHSSEILPFLLLPSSAWRIPGMAEPGRLPSMGSHRVGHD